LSNWYGEPDLRNGFRWEDGGRKRKLLWHRGIVVERKGNVQGGRWAEGELVLHLYTFAKRRSRTQSLYLEEKRIGLKLRGRDKKRGCAYAALPVHLPPGKKAVKPLEHRGKGRRI